jgi:hypothetical protein
MKNREVDIAISAHGIGLGANPLARRRPIRPRAKPRTSTERDNLPRLRPGQSIGFGQPFVKIGSALGCKATTDAGYCREREAMR